MSGRASAATAVEERFACGTALVTGGGSGIGEGLVRRLAASGMTVVVADVDKGRAEAVASEVSAAGGAAVPYAVDVTDPDAVEQLADEVFIRHGSLELLVNNAGIETGGRLWEVDVERWRRLMSINLDGVFHGIRSFVPRMLDQGLPGIVANVASVGGVTTMPFQGPYIASKHAVVALSECLFHDVAGVSAPLQVSVVLPTWVRTRIFAGAQADGPVHGTAAAEHFEAMRRSNQEVGLDPPEAAARILEGLAAGEFWVFTDAERGHDLMRRRGEHLVARTLPVAP